MHLTFHSIFFVHYFTFQRETQSFILLYLSNSFKKDRFICSDAQFHHASDLRKSGLSLYYNLGNLELQLECPDRRNFTTPTSELGSPEL